MTPTRQPTPTGEVILKRLEALSLSIAEIERRTPLTKNTISNAIYGPRQPQRKTIEILAEALDLPIETLTRPASSGEEGSIEKAPEPDDSVRFESFGAWLWRFDNPSLWIASAGAAATAYFLLHGLSAEGIADAIGGGMTGMWVTGIHCAVILLLTTRLPRAEVGPRVLESGPEGLRIAVAAAGDLRRYWGTVWVFWLLLYGLLTVAAWLGSPGQASGLGAPGQDVTATTRWLAVALDLAQNGATVMIFLAYEVVARPTVEADLSRKQVLPTEAWLAFAFLPSVLEAGVVLLDHPWALQQSFGWFSGFAQGTALALLVGRLDSKYIGPPALVVASLYVYAAIQGAWPVFLGQHELMMLMTFLALVLKCLLFLLMEWLFASRLVLYYLERLRVLDEDVRRGRRTFLEKIQ